MQNKLLLVIALFVGFVLGYLLGRGGNEPMDVPPGPKPLSIKHSNGVVTVRVDAKTESGRAFKSSQLNNIVVVSSSPIALRLLRLEKGHVDQLNAAVRTSAVDGIPLEFKDVEGWPFADGVTVDLKPSVLYGEANSLGKYVGDEATLEHGK